MASRRFCVLLVLYFVLQEHIVRFCRVYQYLAMEAICESRAFLPCSSMHWSTKARPTHTSVLISASLCCMVCNHNTLSSRTKHSIEFCKILNTVGATFFILAKTPLIMEISPHYEHFQFHLTFLDLCSYTYLYPRSIRDLQQQDNGV